MNGNHDEQAESSYRRRFDTVMRDDVVADEGDDVDTVNGDNVWASVQSRSKTYTEQMIDILGSDEEEGDARTCSPNLYVNGYDGPQEAPTLQESAADATLDDEVNMSKGLLDSSMMTEEASSISSRTSLRPSRPWQFPAPRRLRMLRVDENGASTSENSLSQLTSPSLLSSDDAGSGRGTFREHASSTFGLLPYGEPVDELPRLHVTDREKDDEETMLPDKQSFLRLSRLCILNDKEGSPTVMAVASGVIAVGTKQGKVALFDRSRGWTGAISIEEPVSALAISSDKTFIAIATAQGSILLYDMHKLHAPARHVPPITTQAVASGRGEGHLKGSRIVHVAFVGARHTAVVSADEHGLSFYHSLGKILGVSSNDTLRILGKYADVLEDADRLEKRSTILAMSPLPLGPQQHQADTHGFVALLTPSKLVLVGLRPAARTWYRRLSPDRKKVQEKVSGCLAWLPCSVSSTPSSATLASGLILPTLAFTFGTYLYIVRLHAGQPGKDLSVREWISHTLTEPVEAMRWLSHESLLLYANRTLRLFDIRKQCCTEEQSFLQPLAMRSLPIRIAERGEVSALLTGSVQSHRGQLFVLTANEIVVGSLITFADRLLACVSRGDSLGAIRLATSYYGDASVGGSRIGLPEKVEDQQHVIAARLLELMRASVAYAFSEERMKDDLAHFPQGVDRTPFFEGLARVCAEACLTLKNLDLLFDELYDAFSDAGIETIFADQMEHFIVQGRMRQLPIPVVQRLIAFRARQERFDLAERIIRNVDPSCLDLDQAISLCMNRKLYDALIYVYTQALHDYVGPIVELLALVKERDGEAYRVFSYLSIALIGRTYPNQDRLSKEEGEEARSSLYSFLFSGRSVMWPAGPDGKLVLTSVQDDYSNMQDEPTFPYLRLLLSFDAEALLDALDIAFEDSWLDEEEQHWTRQRLVSTLYALEGLDEEQRVFVTIFIARNAPKYPQFIRLKSEQVEQLLDTLCSVDLEDDEHVDDRITKEDRQFAAECLLSVYKPADMERLMERFESAGFVDILRRVYRSEQKWDKLANMVVSQPGAEKTFEDLNDILKHSGRSLDRARAIILQALPALVDVNVQRSAALVTERLSGYLNEAIHVLDRSPHRQLDFLTILMNGAQAERVGLPIRSQYLDLMCSMQPNEVVRCLDKHGASYFDLDHVVETARDEDVLDALLWAQDRRGQTQLGLNEVSKALSERALVLRSSKEEADETDVSVEEQQQAHDQVQSLVRMAARVCSERAGVNLWLDLLRSLVRFTHDVQGGRHASILFARAQMQDTLSIFVSSTSADKISFSTLFQQLVPERDARYVEVRDIVDAMTGAYRVRHDMLGITNKLFDRDVFDEMHKLNAKRSKGCRPSDKRCPGCGLRCFSVEAEPEAGREEKRPDLARPASLPVVPKRKSSVAIDVSLSSPRTPSFLDPAVSPRPDKGKGVMRDNDLVANGAHNGGWHSSSDSNLSSLHPESAMLAASGSGSSQTFVEQSGARDYFQSHETSSSDPYDHFTALPIINEDLDSGGGVADMSKSISIDRLPVAKDADTSSIGNTASIDQAVVVYFDGTVWHKRCAPASVFT
jgi:hypothetical protein